MSTPGVIGAYRPGAGTRRLQRSGKIRERESGDVITEALGQHLIIESAHCLADLCQQTALSARLRRTSARVRGVTTRLVCMGIKAAHVTEEDLASRRKSQSSFDLE